MERRRFLTVFAAAVPLAVAGVASALGWRDVPIGDATGPAPQPAPTPPRPVEPADPGPDEAIPREVPGSEPLPLLCRDVIGLVPALAGGVEHSPVRVTIHHSAVLLEDGRDAPRQLRAFQRDHQRRGWVDVAYHRAIDPAGNVYELHDPVDGTERLGHAPGRAPIAAASPTSPSKVASRSPAAASRAVSTRPSSRRSTAATRAPRRSSSSTT